MNAIALKRKPPKLVYTCPPLKTEAIKHPDLFTMLKGVSLYEVITEWIEQKDPQFLELLADRLK